MEEKFTCYSQRTMDLKIGIKLGRLTIRILTQMQTYYSEVHVFLEKEVFLVIE